jgi:putative toxin-antitoxin system antitoxin component (TIGR02293 family)
MSDMKVEEPLAAYGFAPLFLESNVELVAAARNGVHTSMLWDFLKSIGSSKAEFEDLLPYSLKTFSRKEILDEAMGERILSIIRVFRKGEEVFGDISKFKDWIKHFNPYLDDIPKSYLTTSTGCQVVIDELGRIEHGITA